MSFKIFNHAFQGYEHGCCDTRGAPQAIFSKIIKAVANGHTRKARYLMLGVNSGENDFFPMLSCVKRLGTGAKFILIDDSPAICSIVDELRITKDFLLVTHAKPTKKQVWSFKSVTGDISITLYQKDIESYPEDVFPDKEYYDAVIAFFVFNHLTNWQTALEKISKCLKTNGALYMGEYKDDFIAALENKGENVLDHDSFKYLLAFHRDRFNKFGTYFASSLYGCDLSSASRYLGRAYELSLKKSFEYEHKHRCLQRTISGCDPHTPLFWGRKTLFSHHDDGSYDEDLCPDYKDFLKNIENAHIEYLSVGITRNDLILYKFKKLQPLCKADDSWAVNFQNVVNGIDRLIHNPFRRDCSGYEKTRRTQELLLQLLLAHQGLERTTCFLTTLFWDIDRNRVNISKRDVSTVSLVSTRAFEETYIRYLIHLLIFRWHDTQKHISPESYYSIAEIIFDQARGEFDWVFCKSHTNSFASYNIITSGAKYIVIEIPEKYYDQNVYHALRTNFDNYLQDRVRTRYNNYTCFDYSDIVNDILNKNTLDVDKLDVDKLDHELFCDNIITDELEVRRKSLTETFSSPDWGHLSDQEKSKLVNDLSKRIGRFSFLASAGVCVNIINTLFNTEDNCQTSNGGLLLLENLDKNAFISQIKEKHSNISLRYSFLKNTINYYSSKLIIPGMYERLVEEQNEKRRNAILGARAAIMSRNLSHNVGSHALANSRFFESVGILHEMPTSPQPIVGARMGDEGYDGGIFLHKETNCPLRKGEVWRARQRLATFNNFLQGRLDFIARALGESSSPPEPLFFFGDLMQGFFSQGVLLNTLLSDNGITIENMEFHIQMPGMAHPVVYVGRRDEHKSGSGEELRHTHFVKDPDGGMLRVKCVKDDLKDILIGVPGGMVGRHAFYGFLENIMRNAAKYGRRRKSYRGLIKEPLVVRLVANPGAARQRNVASGAKYVPCYWLEIDDNRSIDEPKRAKEGEAKELEGGIARTVRVHLNDPIITSDGKPQSEGHGIQEMKVCAEFLAGQVLCFPPDEEISEAEFKVILNGIDYWHNGDPYRNYITAKGWRNFLEKCHKDDRNRHAWIKAENALQAYNRRLCNQLNPVDKGCSPHLTYRMILQKPVIFGIVDLCSEGTASQQEVIRQAKKNASVHYYDSIATLARESAQFGLIMGNQVNMEKIDATLLEIARHHTALPYRLMVVLPSGSEQDTTCADWQARIDFASAGELPEDKERRKKAMGKDRPNGRVRYKQLEKYEASLRSGCIPTRRIFVIRCPELFDEAGDLAEVGEFQDVQGRKVFQAVYEDWLRAWKGHELKAAGSEFWRLWIGFERELEAAGGSDIAKKWDGLKNFTSDLLMVRVCVREPAIGQGNPDDRGGDQRWSAGSPAHDTDVTTKGNLIVFDNHGMVFPEVPEPSSADGAPACYHSFSGSGQIDLFHTLESPPQDPFGLAYLIYSTVEASLMKIAIVDERVAEAMINTQELLFGDIHTKLLNTGIYPLFQIQPGNKSKPIHLSPAVGEALSKVESEFNKFDETANVWNGRFSLPESSAGLSSGEGLRLISDLSLNRTIQPFIKSGRKDNSVTSVMLSPLNTNSHIDALVIHEGVADVISSKLGDRWKPTDILSFFSESPCIIRTSGRGSQTRHLDSSLPFVEFTVLGTTTYQNLNKVALSRSLLGARST